MEGRRRKAQVPWFRLKRREKARGIDVLLHAFGPEKARAQKQRMFWL